MTTENFNLGAVCDVVHDNQPVSTLILNGETIWQKPTDYIQITYAEEQPIVVGDHGWMYLPWIKITGPITIYYPTGAVQECSPETGPYFSYPQWNGPDPDPGNIKTIFIVGNNVEKIKFPNNVGATTIKIVGMSSITDVEEMFFRSVATELDLDEWNWSSQITSCKKMFASANVSEISFPPNAINSNVTDISDMFERSQIKTVDWSNFNTSSVTNADELFEKSEVVDVDLSNVDFSGIQSAAGMFVECKSLNSVKLFKTGESFHNAYSFFNQSSVMTIDWGEFDTSKCTSFQSFFQSVPMSTIDLSSFNTKSATNLQSMFGNCENLTSLDLSAFDTANVWGFGSMFSGCSSLLEIVNISEFDLSSVANPPNQMGNMFKDCTSLENLDLSGWCVEHLTPPGLPFTWRAEFGLNAPFYQNENNHPRWGESCFPAPTIEFNQQETLLEFSALEPEKINGRVVLGRNHDVPLYPQCELMGGTEMKPSNAGELFLIQVKIKFTVSVDQRTSWENRRFVWERSAPGFPIYDYGNNLAENVKLIDETHGIINVPVYCNALNMVRIREKKHDTNGVLQDESSWSDWTSYLSFHGPKFPFNASFYSTNGWHSNRPPFRNLFMQHLTPGNYSGLVIGGTFNLDIGQSINGNWSFADDDVFVCIGFDKCSPQPTQYIIELSQHSLSNTEQNFNDNIVITKTVDTSDWSNSNGNITEHHTGPYFAPLIAAGATKIGSWVNGGTTSTHSTLGVYVSGLNKGENYFARVTAKLHNFKDTYCASGRFESSDYYLCYGPDGTWGTADDNTSLYQIPFQAPN